MMVLEFRLRADIIIDGMYLPVYNYLFCKEFLA